MLALNSHEEQAEVYSMVGAQTTNRLVEVDDLLAIGALQAFELNQLQRLASLMFRRSYQAGEVIFLEGESSIGLWFLAQGQVKIAKHSLNGRILGLCLMKTGTCFGNCPLFSNETNPAMAQAIDDVTLLILPHEALQRQKQHDPKMTQVLLRIYSQRLAHLARLSESMANWSVGDRINDLLLTYADWGEATPVVVLTHEKLADLAGTVREVVTRHLSSLEQQGIVTLELGRVIINHPQSLQLPCTEQRV